MYRSESRLAPRQWETSLRSNAVSHSLGANLESALNVCYLNSCQNRQDDIWFNLIIMMATAVGANKPTPSTPQHNTYSLLQREVKPTNNKELYGMPSSRPRPNLVFFLLMDWCLIGETRIYKPTINQFIIMHICIVHRNARAKNKFIMAFRPH